MNENKPELCFLLVDSILCPPLLCGRVYHFPVFLTNATSIPNRHEIVASVAPISWRSLRNPWVLRELHSTTGYYCRSSENTTQPYRWMCRFTSLLGSGTVFATATGEHLSVSQSRNNSQAQQLSYVHLHLSSISTFRPQRRHFQQPNSRSGACGRAAYPSTVFRASSRMADQALDRTMVYLSREGLLDRTITSKLHSCLRASMRGCSRLSSQSQNPGRRFRYCGVVLLHRSGPSACMFVSCVLAETAPSSSGRYGLSP
mmetsp:Transcript_45839/g.178161  ORF Transcript_45839/g.178161 Transcript_45839/m.178161 type:complete len:258 (+) Transcript_45839:272-1045(+)